jgi:hypothetical protein
MKAASLTGPALGGVVFARSGYDALFGMIIGIVGLDVLLRLLMEESTDVNWAEPHEEESVDAPPPLQHKKEFMVAVQEINNTPDGFELETTASTIEEAPARMPKFIRLLFSLRFVASLWCVTML